ncbi:MAG TPA: hypothetical protein VFN97_24590, partial [Actinospica sp.]|nr:hypothetical protein [Actinospica sp.]
AGAVTSGRVSFYTLPIEGFATEDGESVNLIDPVKVRTDAQDLIAGKTPPGMAGGGTIPQVPQSAGASENAFGDSLPLTHVAVEAAKTPGAGTAQHHAAAAPASAAPAATTPAAPTTFNPPPGVPCVD